jgi:hypothetical protein
MKQINMSSPVNNYCNELHVEVKFSPFRVYVNRSIASRFIGSENAVEYSDCFQVTIRSVT